MKSFTSWNLTYTGRLDRARKTVKGDKWRDPKTGKTVEVIGRAGYSGVELLHESGRRTVKRDHYLASDYEPVES